MGAKYSDDQILAINEGYNEAIDHLDLVASECAGDRLEVFGYMAARNSLITCRAAFLRRHGFEMVHNPQKVKTNGVKA